MQITQTFLCCLALTVSFVVAADNPGNDAQQGTVVKMPLADKENLHAQDLPKRGQTMNAVNQQYGRPIKKHPAKGQPPIERWDYENFSVYFETNSVIHSVHKTKP